MATFMTQWFLQFRRPMKDIRMRCICGQSDDPREN